MNSSVIHNCLLIAIIVILFVPMRVYILLYNAGTNNEGIHTIQVGDRNKILMFTEKDDAERYALMLEAQDFPTPTVEPIDEEEVKAFCQNADYDCELIESGKLALPPEHNLESTDWDEEGSDSARDTEKVESAESPEPDKSAMSDEELNKIRSQLEGLL